MSSKAKKRVLVCGATGFIGRNIAERLSRESPDFEVVGTHFRRPALDVPGLRMIQADLRDAAQVKRALAGVDIVIQAAATTSGSKDIVNTPFLHVTDNAVMNSILFREAHEAGVGHVVFFSCGVMYPSGEAHAVKEEDFDAGRVHPRYFGVGWTKVYIEKMAEFYAGLGRTRHTVFRNANIYGPHDKYDLEKSHVFGATVTKVLGANDGGKIPVWGDGLEGRDFLYVDDLVRLVELALDRQTAPFALLNAGSGEEVSVRSLIERIAKAAGKTVVPEFDLSKPSIKTSVRLDSEKAKRELDWTPRYSLDEGIRLTLDWCRANLAPN